MGSSSESDGRPGLDIPPDDLKRVLALARPDKDQGLPHVSIAGDTYTEELRDSAHSSPLRAPRPVFAGVAFPTSGSLKTFSIASPDTVRSRKNP
jgi:hypothetical protein